MTKHEIAKLVSRIFSIYVFIIFLETLRELASTLLSLQDTLNIFPMVFFYSMVLSPVLYIIIAILFWVKADFVADRFVNDFESKSDKLFIEGKYLQPIFYSTVGLYLSIQAFITITRIFTSLFIPETFIPRQSAAQFITPVIQLIMGIFLFIGSQRLSEVVNRFQNSDLENPITKNNN